MNIKTYFPIIAFTSVLFGCTYDNYEEMVADAAKKNCSDIPQTVSFNNDIVPILNKYCNTSGCHSGLKPEGNLNLEPAKAYAQLSKKGSGYIESDPKQSILYGELVDAFTPMPPTGKLDDCTIKTVYKWIEQGGKKN